MSVAALNAAFLRALREAYEAFRAEVESIRGQFNCDGDQIGADAGVDDIELLERPTRRFLIDRMLRALGWDPDNPGDVIEEARSWLEKQRLYFDYLGVRPDTKRPVLIVEAKGFDAELPRAPRGKALGAREIEHLVAAALADIKAGKANTSILAQWRAWLGDLRDYVHSLSLENRSSLRRVVSTSGQWMIVFEDPDDAFVKDGPPNADLIHCFTSVEDIISQHVYVRRLLSRSVLVDSLGVDMSVPEALAALRPADIKSYFRGAVLVTRSSGSARQPYPTRTVIPAVIVMSSGRPFAICDGHHAPLEEPRAPDQLPFFLTNLTERASQFERRILQGLGLLALQPLPLAAFTGFPPLLGRNERASKELPIEAAGVAVPDSSPLTEFVIDVGQKHSEYIVVTGQDWFFKWATPSGPECVFHDYPKARQQGVAVGELIAEYSQTTFTKSGEDLHCAHAELHGLRSARCKVDVFDNHLCCRECIFSSLCWATDANRMPCPL